MALLRQIIREQKNQRSVCQQLEILSRGEGGGELDLGCPQPYQLSHPGNRSEELKEMVSNSSGMLKFKVDLPEGQNAIFPTLTNPRASFSSGTHMRNTKNMWFLIIKCLA